MANDMEIPPKNPACAQDSPESVSDPADSSLKSRILSREFYDHFLSESTKGRVEDPSESASPHVLAHIPPNALEQRPLTIHIPLSPRSTPARRPPGNDLAASWQAQHRHVPNHVDAIHSPRPCHH